MPSLVSNLDRYKKDLNSLLAKGEELLIAMCVECQGAEAVRQLQQVYGDKTDQYIKSLPKVKDEYQSWYSEAKALIKQLLPDRLDDFVRHYEKPKSRKEITAENYRIEDFFQGLTLTRGLEKNIVVGPDAAIPHFQQQLAILSATKVRFESSLFDIRQLVQADLFDSELDAAEELARQKFLRAAGALAGVVLERHLRQVCDSHSIKISKANPTIADLNDILKTNSVIDVPQWRFIQHLADIRNLCDHNKVKEPTQEQVNDLVDGLKKITKSVF